MLNDAQERINDKTDARAEKWHMAKQGAKKRRYEDPLDRLQNDQVVDPEIDRERVELAKENRQSGHLRDSADQDPLSNEPEENTAAHQPRV